MLCYGIELKSGGKRPSALAALDESGSLICLQSFFTDAELRSALPSEPALLAFAAPITLPKGLCCLDPKHPCQLERPQNRGRFLEAELSRMGISCFYTSKNSITRDLIMRAVTLTSSLNPPHSVIEVYPYATKKLLFGDKVPAKGTMSNLKYMTERLAPVIPNLKDWQAGLDKENVDCVLSAYTALLCLRGETATLGHEDEGLLVIPKQRF